MGAAKWAIMALAGLAAAAAAQVPVRSPSATSVAVAQGVEGSPLSPGATAPALVKPDVDAWLDGFFPYALKRGDVAGAVVVVVKDGQVLTQRGYGFADVEARKPVDPATTMFRPGSVSKLFTWTSVMQLVEQGRLNLDADINTYLDFKIPPRDGKPITLRNIMTHTPGFEEAVRGLITDGRPGLPMETVLKRWTPKRIFAPGTTPAYSNYATALAGYIVQRTSGMAFDDYVERNIFGRIGMRHASFRQPLPAALQPFMSRGYALGSGKPLPFEVIDAAPAGSLSAAGGDMGRFMIAHLADGGPLLRPQTARMMHTTTLTLLPPLNRLALGFYEQNLNGHRIISHGGDTRVFHSGLWLFLDDNVGMFVSLNSAGREGATGAIRTALLHQFADRYFPGETRDTQVDPATAKAHAQAMVGDYIVTRRSDSSFMRAGALLGQSHVATTSDGGLRIDAIKTLGGAARKWTEIAPYVWREVGGEDRLAAKVVDGKVTRFSFDAVSPIMMWEPTPWYAAAAWFIPAIVAALAILLVAALSWPVAAISRRVHGASAAIDRSSRWTYHLLRGFALLALIVGGGWLLVLTAMSSELKNLNGGLDGQVIALQLLGPIALVGLIASALFDLRVAFIRKRSWLSRGWAVLLLVAALMAGWSAFVLGFIGFGLSY